MLQDGPEGTAATASGTPLGRRPVDQFVVAPYLLVTTCSPVTRSTRTMLPSCDSLNAMR